MKDMMMSGETGRAGWRQLAETCHLQEVMQETLEGCWLTTAKMRSAAARAASLPAKVGGGGSASARHAAMPPAMLLFAASGHASIVGEGGGIWLACWQKILPLRDDDSEARCLASARGRWRCRRAREGSHARRRVDARYVGCVVQQLMRIARMIAARLVYR